MSLLSRVQKAGFLTMRLIWAIRKVSLGFRPRSETNWVVQQAVQKAGFLTMRLIWAIRKVFLGFRPRSETNWVVQQAGHGTKLVISDIHV